MVSLGPVTPTAFVYYGAGVPGTADKMPLPAGSDEGTPGGLVTISFSAGRPNAVGVMFMGIAPVSLPFKDKTLLVAESFLQVPLNFGPAGTSSLLGAVPADANLYDIDVCHQF